MIYSTPVAEGSTERRGLIREQGENQPFGLHGNVHRFSDAETFTITNVRYLAAKVKTDLMRLHHYYGIPSEKLVDDLHEELVLAMKHDIMKSVTYGFCVGFKWVKGLHYEMRQGGVCTGDDDPGGIAYKELPEGAVWHSVLEFNANWKKKQSDYRDFKRFSPIDRGEEPAPPPNLMAFERKNIEKF